MGQITVGRPSSVTSMNLNQNTNLTICLSMQASKIWPASFSVQEDVWLAMASTRTVVRSFAFFWTKEMSQKSIPHSRFFCVLVFAWIYIALSFFAPAFACCQGTLFLMRVWQCGPPAGSEPPPWMYRQNLPRILEHILSSAAISPFPAQHCNTLGETASVGHDNLIDLHHIHWCSPLRKLQPT